MSRLTDILEATDAALRGGFGDFTRSERERDAEKGRRKPGRRRRERAAFKPEHNILDKAKAKMRKFGSKASKFIDKVAPKSEDRFEKKMARRSGAARDFIKYGHLSPKEQERKRAEDENRRKEKLAQGKRVADRTMPKDEYKAIRDRERQAGQKGLVKMVPLHRTDEAKVRQLVRRLSPEQAIAFGRAIETLVNPPAPKKEKEAA